MGRKYQAVVYTIALSCLAVPFILRANPPGTCPSDMVWVTETASCIDRYEWPNQVGVHPATSLSAIRSSFDSKDEMLNIEELCASVGKRACNYDEWVAACKGPHGSEYPFGPELPKLTRREDAPCNYAKMYRKPDEYKVFWRNAEELARLDQSDPSGTHGCVSASGAEDMMGNAEEWIQCPTWLASNGWCLAGRYWGDPEPCGKVATGHDPGWHFYETGGRCCKSVDL